MTIQLDFQLLTYRMHSICSADRKGSGRSLLLFADQIGHRYPGDAANFFTMMARNEQRHGVEISKQRRLLFGDTPSRVTENMIENDIEPGSWKSNTLHVPRHALEVAMESEIKLTSFITASCSSFKMPQFEN